MSNRSSMIPNQIDQQHRRNKSPKFPEMFLKFKNHNWSPGEKEELWVKEDLTVSAYLEEKCGVVVLYLTIFPDDVCVIFQQEPLTTNWYVSETIRNDYENWKKRMLSRLLPPSNKKNPNTSKLRRINSFRGSKYQLRRKLNYGQKNNHKTVQSRFAS